MLESPFIKVAGSAGSATSFKKESNTDVFLWNLRNFEKTYFVEYLQTATSGSCNHSIWTCFEIKDVDSTEFFRKMKLPSPHLKKGLLNSWKYLLRIVLEFFKNCEEYINSKRNPLKMLWERVQFSKVWSLQPATLLLAYSFIRHKLLYRCCWSFLRTF